MRAHPGNLEPGRLSGVDRLLGAAVGRGAMPGGCWAVGLRGGPPLVRAFGRLSCEPDSVPAVPSTLYDLASVTKVAATTFAAMVLAAKGRLDIDAKVADFLPQFRAGVKPRIAIRNLLVHNSGLAASHPNPTDFTEAGDLLESILSQAPVSEPGSVTLYSDLGFVALGCVIERVAGMPLDVVAAEGWSRLEMKDTMYRPAPELRRRCAPTEAIEPWRAELRRRRGIEGSEKWIVGEVHDPTAAVLGGVAGHAGVFSTAGDLARFLRAMLEAGEVIEAFTARASPDSSRALGWDTPEAGSSAGVRFGPRSFGHTGFTGTSVWADPDAGLVAVLLTNRVHPAASNLAIREVRREFHDAVFAALTQ